MEMLVSAAAAFGQRPSTLMDIRDPLVALNFDLAGAVVLGQIRQRANGE